MDRGRPAALVIGAGIAGIQAALDIADAGYQVSLVEREPSVGGRMSQLDKTFPTLDCSSCILTPKMVDVGRHPNIELMTYCEVVSVEEDGGTFIPFVRGPASDESGAPSVLAMSDELAEVRVIFVSLPLYLLPEEAKSRLVMNMVDWMLSP